VWHLRDGHLATPRFCAPFSVTTTLLYPKIVSRTKRRPLRRRSYVQGQRELRRIYLLRCWVSKGRKRAEDATPRPDA